MVGDSRLVAAVLARDFGSQLTLVHVRTGELALERLLLDASIDAVVSELTLPGMSGQALLNRLRQSNAPRLRSLPFVALAGNDDPRRALDVIAAGASAFVAKRNASRELGAALVAHLPERFEVRLPRTAGAMPSARTSAPTASVMRLRWEARHGDGRIAEGPPQSSVDPQIRYMFESHLRTADRWQPDGDGHGGVLGMACGIEDSLRPMLRLASHLRDAALRLGRQIAIAVRLEATEPTRVSNGNRAELPGPAPDLPGAGELLVALPSGNFRLNLSSVGQPI